MMGFFFCVCVFFFKLTLNTHRNCHGNECFVWLSNVCSVICMMDSVGDSPHSSSPVSVGWCVCHGRRISLVQTNFDWTNCYHPGRSILVIQVLLSSKGFHDAFLPITRVIIKVSGHQYWWLAGWLWPGNKTSLEVASTVITWWIVAFLPSECNILMEQQLMLLSSTRTSVRLKLGLFNAKIRNENRRYIHRLIYQINEQDLLCNSI